MTSSTCLFLAGGCALLVGTASAQSPHRPQPLDSRAERIVVTPAGAFERAGGSAAPADAPQQLSTAGLIWTHTDGGLLWLPRAVAIGNHGSEVFADYNLNNERAELFSAFDANPPMALWTDLSPLGSDFQHVASAEEGSIHVALQTFNSGHSNASCVLKKYSALGGGVADWSYTFPVASDSTNLCISRDGQTIVAIVNDRPNSAVKIAVFSPDSNVPRSYTTLSLGGTNNYARGMDLSADGSTLYLSTGLIPVVANIFDVASTTVVFSTPLVGSFDSHAISGDGSVFAYGDFNLMAVWEKVAGVYTNTFTRLLTGMNYCARIDISDDGSTIACGWNYNDFFLTVRIEAIDVPTHNLIMNDVVTSGDPTLQNAVSAVSISADGRRFGVGLWGDGSGPLRELRLYARDQNTPIATRNLNGSILGLKISGDGKRVAAGSKAVHANQMGNGGQIDLFGDETPFTSFCFPGAGLPTACPCANVGVLGHGCENSSTTGGALLSAAGDAASDSVVLTANGELPTVLSIVLQGDIDNSNGVLFGDGVRCVGGLLLRLYTRNAVDGVLVAPLAGEASIQSRSAALGDPISAGDTRSYQVYYRDPVAGYCSSPSGDSWNISNALRIDW